MMIIKNRIVLMILLNFVRSSFADTAEEQRLLKIIEDGQAASDAYVLPTNAREYQPSDLQIQDYGEYDFIICGAGPSGTVMAKRLSDIGDWNILILEAGDFSDGTNGFLQFPRFFAVQAFSKYNWGYQTVPQATGCLGNINKTCPIHIGKGVGGTTLISPVIYDRGHPETYNSWANTANDNSWTYKNILKYFKNIETFNWTDREAPVDLLYHGTSGPLLVQHKLPIYGDGTWLAANAELGYNVTDYNGIGDGGSITQHFYKNGAREDFGTTFIQPMLYRNNLKISIRSFITKIVINPYTKIAESVIFTKAGKTYRARAKIEIIISAGPIATPQLLMLSGVGPCQHLSSVGINCIQNLEVGSQLRSTVSVSLTFSTNSSRPPESFADWVKDYVNTGTGDLTTSSKAQPIGKYRLYGTQSTSKIPNVEILSDIASKSPRVSKYLSLSPDIYDATWGTNINAISFSVTNINPVSTGTLRLRNSSPYEYPIIDPKVLFNPQDIDTLFRGIQLVFQVIGTYPYVSFGTTYNGAPIPPCRQFQFLSKGYWNCYAQYTSTTSYNPSGACPMGTNPELGAVVDSKLRVFGVYGLRIADASVFPSNPSGYNNIPAAMVGSKLADELILQYFFN